ncbi:unnamed protein product [Lymnaea stagnalis]|uniref:GH18 domain-containing protein n=1 Tax=Lymnaea stagnalis TaxID=6523 RepID=A0AAV2ILR2_LYMST
MSHVKILCIVASFLLVTSAQRSLPPCRRFICVFKARHTLTKPYVISVSDVDPDLCTHILLYAAPLDGNKLSTPYWEDDKRPGGIYDQLKQLKVKKSKLKILLTVGGHYSLGKPWTDMTATEAGRREFIHFLIPFLRDREFDGVDLFWHWPGFLDGSAKSDRERYADLIKEMATAFKQETLIEGRKRLIFSAWGPKDPRMVDVGINVTAFARYVDFVTVQAYNYNTAPDIPINHMTPLQSPDGRNIKDCLEYWVERGIPRPLINIALSAYGRRVYTQSSSDMTIGESMAKGKAPGGKYTHMEGALTYYEICMLLKEGGKVGWDSLAQTPYHIQDKYFLTYENEQSYKEKVRFLRKNCYGGFVIRTLEEDDFLGLECGKGKFPLTRTVKTECTKRMN